MQRKIGSLRMVFALLIVFLLISASCTTPSGVGGNSITGKSWNHPNKAMQEQQQDLFDCENKCQQEVRAKGYSGDFAIFKLRDCEDQCMFDKGYKWY